MATTINFRKLLRKTPFKLVREHMDLASESASHVVPCLKAFIAGDMEKLKEQELIIRKLENDADETLEEVQSNLPKKIWTPVVREDILGLLIIQEKIADRPQDIVELMIELPLNIPKEMGPPLIRLAKHCANACKEAAEIIRMLEQLSDIGFEGPYVDKTKKQISDVIKMESEADDIQKELNRILFTQKSKLDALDVIFIYKIINWIDDLADESEKLAIHSRLFLAK